MLPGRVSNTGPPTYESGVLPIALRGPAAIFLSGTLVLVLLTVNDKYSVLYRTQPQSLFVLWLCYVVTFVR